MSCTGVVAELIPTAEFYCHYFLFLPGLTVLWDQFSWPVHDFHRGCQSQESICFLFKTMWLYLVVLKLFLNRIIHCISCDPSAPLWTHMEIWERVCPTSKDLDGIRDLWRSMGWICFMSNVLITGASTVYDWFDDYYWIIFNNEGFR